MLRIGTSTDVHVLLNDSPIFDGTVNGYGAGTGPAFNTNLTLQAGDRVDFAVGYGNGSFYYDSTGINARIVREAPCLLIAFADTNAVVVTWPLPGGGWLLHATTNLAAAGGGWTEIPPPYQTNGANLQFSEPLPAEYKFYRLHKP